MSKGKTFSITVPLPLFEKIEKEAKEQDISRSKCVYNILKPYYAAQKLPGVAKPLCIWEGSDGTCTYYGTTCTLCDEAKQRCDNFEKTEG